MEDCWRWFLLGPAFVRCAELNGACTGRELTVAPGNCVHGTWHEAVIGFPSSTTASMTGIEGRQSSSQAARG